MFFVPKIKYILTIDEFGNFMNTIPLKDLMIQTVARSSPIFWKDRR